MGGYWGDSVGHRLMGRHDELGGVIFEAKTITDRNELAQSRSGLSQLLQYRVEYGTTRDLLCLVVDAELSLRRTRLLDELGVAVLLVRAPSRRAMNDLGSKIAEHLGASTSLTQAG
jgi:hypothetical protein